MKSSIAALIACVVGLLGFSSVVNAQEDSYPPRVLIVTIDNPNPSPGERFEVTVAGCVDGEVVSFQFGSASATVPCSVDSPIQSLVATDSPIGKTTTTFSAPPATGVFNGTAAVVSTTNSITADFSIEVGGTTVEPASTTLAAEASDSGPLSVPLSTLLSLMVMFLAGVILASAVWVVAIRRDNDDY